MLDRPESVTDMLGNDVTEGDRVAVAMSAGDSAVMRIGRVTHLTPSTMAVLWEGRKYGSGVSNVQHKIKKFILINELTR